MNQTFSLHRKTLRAIAVLLMLFMLVPLASGLANAADPYLSEGYVKVGPKAGTKTISVKNATGSVKASSNKEWLTCSVKGSTVTLQYKHNTTLVSRDATVTISVGTKKLYLFLHQTHMVQVKKEGATSYITQASFSGYSANENLYLVADGEGTISVTKDKDWINVSVAYGKIRITTANNYTGAERKGTVTIKDGYSELKFWVIQKKFVPTLRKGEFMFTMKPVSDSFKKAYNAVKDHDVSRGVTKTEVEALKRATLEYLGVPYNAFEIYLMGPLEIEKTFGKDALQLNSAYEKKQNFVFVNWDRVKTGEAYAYAIIHETRHYWQGNYGAYNSTYTKYVIKYGWDHYKDPTDDTQICEVDAYEFADRVVELLKK